MKPDLNKCADNLKKHLDSLSEEEMNALKEKYFPEDTTPKGWVSIEDSLPFCTVDDLINKGYSTYKVKDKKGIEPDALNNYGILK